MLLLLLLLLLPPTLSYWPTARGEYNGGCASQRTGPAQLTLAASVALPPPLALSPLASTSGTLYALSTGGAPSLSALAGDTLAALATLPLPPAAALPNGLQPQQDGSLWVSGLGLLDGDTLVVKRASALQPALAITALDGSATTLVTLEPCGGAAPCLVVRSLATGGSGEPAPVCSSSPLPFSAILTSVRADDATAFLVMQQAPAAGSALVSLDLATCATSTGAGACAGGARTVMAPFFSALLVDVCAGGGGGEGVEVAILSTGPGLPPLYTLAPAAPGYAAGACAAPPGSPPSAALYTEPTQQHAILLLSCALQPLAPSNASAPFLLAFDLSALPSAALQLWAQPLAAPLRGLAVDRAGTAFAAAAPHGAQGLYGGLLAFSAASGAQLAATPCCQGSGCPDCGVYSQPALGKDGSLYAFVLTQGQWQGLAAFHSPAPPTVSAAQRSAMQQVLLAVGGAAVGLALCGVVGWRGCSSRRAALRAEEGEGEWEEGEEEEEEGSYVALPAQQRTPLLPVKQPAPTVVGERPKFMVTRLN